MLKKKRQVYLPLALVTILSSCSFRYGDDEEEESAFPEIVMLNVEYVRVEGGIPVVRFFADMAELYDARQIMNLENLNFEQFQNNWDTIDIHGNAGKAQIETETGNVSLSEGVFISVESEDISIQTSELRWQDSEKQLLGSATDAVNILRSDGTRFTGVGFSANARSRTWVFDSGASGVFVETGDEEEEITEGPGNQ